MGERSVRWVRGSREEGRDESQPDRIGHGLGSIPRSGGGTIMYREREAGSGRIPHTPRSVGDERRPSELRGAERLGWLCHHSTGDLPTGHKQRYRTLGKPRSGDADSKASNCVLGKDLVPFGHPIRTSDEAQANPFRHGLSPRGRPEREPDVVDERLDGSL
jgi:hypothetical protein